MKISEAVKLFQIPKGTRPTNEYLKKRYRYIASKIHPDKFLEPGKKLHAHNRFIKLQDAYDCLRAADFDSLRQEIDGIYGVTIKHDYSENQEKNTNTTSDKEHESFETEYVDENSRLSWLIIFIFPGLLVTCFMWGIPFIAWFLFIEKKIIVPYTFSEIVMTVVGFIIGVLPTLLFLLAIPYLLYLNALDGSWFSWFMLIQVALAHLYYCITYVVRKCFMKGIRYDKILLTISDT